jgi:hypothetical protein
MKYAIVTRGSRPTAKPEAPITLADLELALRQIDNVEYISDFPVKIGDQNQSVVALKVLKENQTFFMRVDNLYGRLALYPENHLHGVEVCNTIAKLLGANLFKVR